MAEHISDERTKWVRVSTELLAQLGEWSAPVQVRVTGEHDDEYQMEFRSWDYRQAVSEDRNTVRRRVP